LELENLSIEGDELVGYRDGYERVDGALIPSAPVPLAEIFNLEVGRGRTASYLLGIPVVLYGILALISSCLFGSQGEGWCFSD
jgi:hypothetical protein